MKNPIKLMKEMREAEKEITPEKLAQQYAADRATFLAIIVFTVINAISVIFGHGVYYYFSAAIPYILITLAWGKGAWLTAGALVVSAVMLAVYFVCWLKSKEDKKWMKIGAILFCVDVAVLAVVFIFQRMAFVQEYDSLLYMLISGWALWILLRSAFDIQLKR